MKPFGQWLNDCGGSPAKEPTNEPEIASDWDNQYDEPAAEATAQFVVPCRCDHCGKPLDCYQFGLKPEQVKLNDHFLCDGCFSTGGPS